MDDDLSIWLCGPDDVHEVMQLAMLACDENALLKPSEEKLLYGIWPGLVRENAICVAIGKEGGQIEGVMLLNIGQLWYSAEMILEERAIFIHPQFRRGKVGRAKKLAEYAKHVADMLELPLVIGVLSNERTEAKVRMYSRVFGSQAGAFFVYGAKTGHHGVESIN